MLIRTRIISEETSNGTLSQNARAVKLKRLSMTGFSLSAILSAMNSTNFTFFPWTPTAICLGATAFQSLTALGVVTPSAARRSTRLDLGKRLGVARHNLVLTNDTRAVA